MSSTSKSLYRCQALGQHGPQDTQCKALRTDAKWQVLALATPTLPITLLC